MSAFLHPTDLPPQPPPSALVRTGTRELRLDLVLRGDPRALRDGFLALLRAEGWESSWDPSGWSGVATRGSKVMNFLFGAFAQYHEMTFAFSTRPDGSVGLTVYRAGDGCIGGLWGMYKVRKSFQQTATVVEQHFAQAGALVSATGQ